MEYNLYVYLLNLSVNYICTSQSPLQFPIFTCKPFIHHRNPEQTVSLMLLARATPSNALS